MDNNDFAPVPENEQVSDETLKNLSNNKGDDEDER